MYYAHSFSPSPPPPHPVSPIVYSHPLPIAPSMHTQTPCVPYHPSKPFCNTVERLYCKRPILWLASSKIFTPPTSPPGECVPPPLVRGEDTLAGWRGGWRVNILEDARHSSVFLRKHFVCNPFPASYPYNLAFLVR